MTSARLKHYGWGREGEAMTAEEQAFVWGRYHAKFGRESFETIAVPGLDDIELPPPRVAPPSSIATFWPSTKPASLKPLRYAARRWTFAPGRRRAGIRSLASAAAVRAPRAATRLPRRRAA